MSGPTKIYLCKLGLTILAGAVIGAFLSDHRGVAIAVAYGAGLACDPAANWLARRLSCPMCGCGGVLPKCHVCGHEYDPGYWSR